MRLHRTSRLHVHRHTGGLEIESDRESLNNIVHRHTGGLENYDVSMDIKELVHRHTGGLEMHYDNVFTVVGM